MYGVIRMLVVVGFESLNVIIEVFSGAIRGLGNSFLPAFICIVGICGVRMVWLYTVFPIAPSFHRILAVYPISWAVAAFALVICYYITKKQAFRLPKISK